MKATLPNGTVIEGTPEELRALGLCDQPALTAPGTAPLPGLPLPFVPLQPTLTGREWILRGSAASPPGCTCPTPEQIQQAGGAWFGVCPVHTGFSFCADPKIHGVGTDTCTKVS